VSATREQDGGARLAEVVAAQIEQEIMSRGWPIGEVIGSEPELIEKMGVSRAVFREAVRIIEHHNVARMRRGPGGGLVVTAPDSVAVQRAVALYLRYAGVSHENLFATRTTLELACATQAAENITEAGIERLRAVLAVEEQLREQAIPTGHTHDLHVAIAELTGNPVMTLFVQVLTELTRQQQLPHADVGRAIADYHHAHEALVDAIVAGDAAMAQHRMRRHLEAIAVVVGKTPSPPLADETIALRERGRRKDTASAGKRRGAAAAADGAPPSKASRAGSSAPKTARLAGKGTASKSGRSAAAPSAGRRSNSR
jgi:DNA-binding FadR family transcriptional regulator